jgi:hypothetical protein
VKVSDVAKIDDRSYVDSHSNNPSHKNARNKIGATDVRIRQLPALDTGRITLSCRRYFVTLFYV